MSLFRFPEIAKFSEIAQWLRISRVSQPQKKSRKFAGRIRRFLRNCEIGQILRKYFILLKKTKRCSKKILQFRGEVGLGLAWNSLLGFWGDFWFGEIVGFRWGFEV